MVSYVKCCETDLKVLKFKIKAQLNIKRQPQCTVRCITYLLSDYKRSKRAENFKILINWNRLLGWRLCKYNCVKTWPTYHVFQGLYLLSDYKRSKRAKNSKILINWNRLWGWRLCKYNRVKTWPTYHVFQVCFKSKLGFHSTISK